MPTKHSRVRLAAATLSLLVLLVAAGPTQGASPPRHEIDLFQCAQAGGSITVPSGTPFYVVDGWFAKTLWQQAMFLLSVKVQVGVDGTPIAHPFRYWTKPTFSDEDGLWFLLWKYPHAALGPGELIVFTEAWTFRFPIYDGFEWFPRGTFLDETCVITGA